MAVNSGVTFWLAETLVRRSALPCEAQEGSAIAARGKCQHLELINSCHKWFWKGHAFHRLRKNDCSAGVPPAVARPGSPASVFDLLGWEGILPSPRRFKSGHAFQTVCRPFNRADGTASAAIADPHKKWRAIFGELPTAKFSLAED